MQSYWKFYQAVFNWDRINLKNSVFILICRHEMTSYPVGKIFRYEGGANSQNLANFGNRTASEIRCRFDQRIRKFFVRRITSEFVLSSLCELFPNFAMRITSEFVLSSLCELFPNSLCEFAANSQKDFSCILCARRNTAEGAPNSISIRNPNFRIRIDVGAKWKPS